MALTLETRQSNKNTAGTSVSAVSGNNNGGLLGGSAYLNEKMALGFLSSVEGIWDYTAGGIAKLFGADQWAERQFVNDWVNYNHADEWFDPGKGWQIAGDVAGGIGTSLPSIAAAGGAAALTVATGGAAAPAAIKLLSVSVAPLVAGLGAAGNATKSAYQKTGELGLREFGYGALSGATEAGVEALTAGIGTGTGRIVSSLSKKAAGETVSTLGKSGAFALLKTLGADFASEAIEEGLAEAVDPLYQRWTKVDPNAQNASAKEIGYAALVGGLSGIVMSGGAAAVNTTANLFSGDSSIKSGTSGAILDTARQISEYESANDTGYKSFQTIRDAYSQLSASLAGTGGQVSTVKQKMLLGSLKRAETAAFVEPFIERSAMSLLTSSESAAERFSALGMTDANGKQLTFTAEQIRSGVDAGLITKFSEGKLTDTERRTLTKQVRKAIGTNSVLTTLAVMDATGRISMDAEKFAQAALSGRQIATAADLNRFIETASPAQIENLSKKLKIDNWAALTPDVFQSRVAEFNATEEGQAYRAQMEFVKQAQTIADSESKKLPRLFRSNTVAQGLTHYASADGRVNMALLREGDRYHLYDYETGNPSRDLTLAEVNSAIRPYWNAQGNAQSTAQTAQDAQKPMEVQTEGVSTETPTESATAAQTVRLNMIAAENITDWRGMSEPNRAAVRMTMRQALAAGMDEDTALTFGRVAARSGMNIVFSTEQSGAGDARISGNTIYIDPEADNGRMENKLLLHEAGHALMREAKGVRLIARAFETVEPDRSSQIAQKYQKFYQQLGMRMDQYLPIIDEEIAAAGIEDTLGNINAWEYILSEEPSFGEKLLNFFRGAARDYSTNEGLSSEARKLLNTYKKMFAELSERNRGNNAITLANEAKMAGDINDSRFSLKYADTIAYNQRITAKNRSFITMEELDKAIADTDRMVGVMKPHEKILPKDKEGKTLVKNGSYDVSVENTTVCIRTLSYNAFVDMVSEKIHRPLSQMESFLVSQKLYDIAKEPQCLYCYVSLDRKAYNEMLLRYISQRDEAIAAYKEAGMPEVTRTSKLYEDFRNKRKDTDEMWGRYRSWIDAAKNGEHLLTADDIATEQRREELAKGSGNEAAQVKDMLKYAQSASWAKKQTQYAAYFGDILRLSPRVVNNLNRHYGLRWYSFSDYSGAFIVENMQQITDASIRGLKGLSYTKDTDFAKIFAPTGMNINISVYAKRVGDHYEIDPKQSADLQEAIALRKKYPNVGIVAVATDQAGVEWALEQEWSDVVIPFHTVRTGAQVAEFYDWTVFNEEQNDSVKDENLWKAYVDDVAAGKSDSAKKKVSKMVYPSEHQNNREKYLKLIEERGLKPRFSSFLDNPNYMKLVNETRQSEAQTSPLKPVYDLDAAERSFAKFVEKGGYYEGWYNDGIDVNAEAEIVAQDIRSGKKANEVEYGRQDVDYEQIAKGRKSQRAHGERFALKEISDVVDKALANQGEIGEKYNQKQISEVPENVADLVSKASGGKIDISNKMIALNGDDIWHEYRSHGDEIKERGKKQIPLTPSDIKAAVGAIYDPDVVESVFSDINNPTQRQSFAYAKKSPDGHYVVVEAIGGKRNPNIIPVMILQFSEEKWNDMLNDGITLGELFHENDPKKKNALDIDFNKRNRVTVARSTSNEVIASFPRSPRFNESIADSEPKVNSKSKKSSDERLALPEDKKYLDAVKSGDMETAQRMVDEAAKKAGYTPVKRYHQTGHKFTRFSNENPDAGLNDSDTPNGYFFKDNDHDIGVGADFVKTGHGGSIQMEVYLNDSNLLYFENRDAAQKWYSKHVPEYAKILQKYNNHIEEYKRIDKENTAKMFEELNALVEKGEDTAENELAVMDKYDKIIDGWIAEKEEYETSLRAQMRKLLNTYFIESDSGYNGIELADDGHRYIDGKREDVHTYIVFNNTQIKSADPVTYDDNGNVIPLSERFNANNSDIRYALPEDGEKKTSETRESIMTKVDPEYKPTMQDKVFSGWTAAQISFTNAQAGIEAVGKKYKVKNIESLVQAARSGGNQAEEMIAGNQYRIGAASKAYQGEGLEQILRPIYRQGEDVKGDFYDYLFNWHNISRMTLEERSAEWQKQNGEKGATPLENKPIFSTVDENGNEEIVTAEQSKEIIKKYDEAHPEFKETAEKLWAFLRNLNQYRVDTGLISKETYDYLEKLYPHYVPTYRTGANKGIGAIEGKYNLKVKTTIKTAKGSTRALLPPDVMIARQVMETIRAGRINQLANALYEGALNTGDTTYIEVISKKRVSNADMADLDPTEIRPKNNEVIFFRDGEQITMRVSKEIFAGFNAFNPAVEIHNPLINGARKINNGFKRIVTSLNPAFLIRNAIRDVQDAGINTKYGKTFVKNYARASYEISHNGKLWQLYKAMGGFSSSVFDFEKGFSGMQNKWGLTKAEGNLLKQGLQSVENANAFVEQLPRLAEFISSIEAGNTAEQAILDSADVTTNFGRSGNVAKELNRTLIPFLNPSIQGFSKMIRNITSIRSAREFASLAVKATIVGIVPMVLNMLMYDDDEEYKDLRETDKENNFLFKIGDTFIKIPRGRVASVVGGLVNRGKETIDGEDADWAGYVKNVMQQVTPVDSMSRTIFSPFSDVANNLTWYGSAIEGRQFENTAPKDRYDENTSSIAIVIGKVINYSPKKIHYLLDQYSGVIGDFILPATTAKAENDFLSGNFTIDPATSNKLSAQFYKIYDEAQYAKTSGDDTAAYQVRYLNKVKSAVSEMYRQKSEIQNDPNLTRVDKLQQTRVVQLLINEAYKTAIEDFELYTKAIEATAGMEDESLRFVEATRLMYGAERALSEYNADVYEKCNALNKAGVEYDVLYNYYFTVRSIAGDKDVNGNTINGSKRKKVVAYIKSMKIPTDQKLLLISASGYSLQDGDVINLKADVAKRRLIRYIVNLSGASKSEKAVIAEICGFKVNNGRVLMSSLNGD